MTTSCSPALFELQLVNLRAGNQIIMIANIYRPPLNPKSMFLVDLSNLYHLSVFSQVIASAVISIYQGRDRIIDEDLLAVLV